VLRYLGVNSGDMQKGVMRIEPNVSVRPAGSLTLRTRVEIKNLNSFRALERSVNYEIKRQIECIENGGSVRQETLGWDVVQEITFTQRVKEGEEDYRYFPEPDLPPLVLDAAFIEQARRTLPELPAARLRRFQQQYGLSAYDAGVLVAEQAAAAYYEQTVMAAASASPKMIANWIISELFGLIKQNNESIEVQPVSAQSLAELLDMVAGEKINASSAKSLLAEMYRTHRTAGELAAENGLVQLSDAASIARLVSEVLEQNPGQVQAYLAGKETISRWLFGQVMRLAKNQANPRIIQSELDRQLNHLKQQ
jgi:aspartyl-tRNA(Asn)/glutamyl-tRNA(Gln) amidotransferase subunit B